jgi:hypothetical protein
MLTLKDISIIKERLATATVCGCGNCNSCFTAGEWVVKDGSVVPLYHFEGFGLESTNKRG